MQEIRSSDPSVVTGICDPNKSRAGHHRNNDGYLQAPNSAQAEKISMVAESWE